MFSDSGMDLESIAEQVFEQLSIQSESDDIDTSCMSDDVTSCSGHSHDEGSGHFGKMHGKDGGLHFGPPPLRSITPNLQRQNSHLGLQKQAGRLCLNFLDALSGAPYRTYYKLFRGVLGWIDPELNVFMCSEKPKCFTHEHDHEDIVRKRKRNVDIPALAVVLFLQEEESKVKESDSEEDQIKGKISEAKDYFKHKPWRFHHSEYVGQGRIKATPHSTHDYHFLTYDLPLCSVRQIHCGEEHLRLVRFITYSNWADSLRFYQLLLGKEPDAIKQDFCVFTADQYSSADLQLALKRLSKGIEPRHTKKCVLSFKVKEIGSLVPLLPHTCCKVSDMRWRTYDLDGNEVHLEVQNLMSKPIRPPHARHTKLNKHGLHLSRLPASRPPSRTSSHCSVSSSSSTLLSNCSAFSPVPASVPPHLQQVANDRLSPRVFLHKPMGPDVLHKVQSELSTREREVYTPVIGLTHQHTDSGIIEDRTDQGSDDSVDSLLSASKYEQLQHCQQVADYLNDSNDKEPRLPEIDVQDDHHSSAPLCHSSPVTQSNSQAHPLGSQVNVQQSDVDSDPPALDPKMFAGSTKNYKLTYVSDLTESECETTVYCEAGVDLGGLGCAQEERDVYASVQGKGFRGARVEEQEHCLSVTNSKECLVKDKNSNTNSASEKSCQSVEMNLRLSKFQYTTAPSLHAHEQALGLTREVNQKHDVTEDSSENDDVFEAENVPSKQSNCDRRPNLQIHSSRLADTRTSHNVPSEGEPDSPEIIHNAHRPSYTDSDSDPLYENVASIQCPKHLQPPLPPKPNINHQNHQNGTQNLQYNHAKNDSLDTTQEEECNEGEPDDSAQNNNNPPRINGIISSRRQSLGSKRVHFSDTNENFVYEKIEVESLVGDYEYNQYEEDSSDTGSCESVLENKVYRSAEGQTENVVLEDERNVWQQIKSNPDVGFYI